MNARAATGLRHRTKTVRFHVLLVTLLATAGAGLAVWRGQDNNYDQLNYHTYVAYAFTKGRILQDVAPSEVMHNFFSPVVYLPFFVMVGHLPPRAVAAILGAVQGLNGWLVFCIALIVTRPLRPGPRLAAAAAALAASIASPMALSEIGTSMADILTSLLVLAGLALLMQAEFRRARRASIGGWIVVAGMLVGAATSLKLTNASFAIGLAAASVVGWTTWRDRLTAFAATGLGGIIGFAACGGSWYIAMWQTFRNPVFPYFNNVFQSPDYPRDHALFDTQHIPHSLLRAVSYPFLWIRSQAVTNELDFRDIRFALLTILLLLALAFRLLPNRRVAERWQPAGQRLVVFVLVAFCVWLYEWSIQRYIVVLELLAGPTLIVLLQWSGGFRAQRLGAAVAAVLAFVCVMTVKSPDWGHLRWGATWYSAEVPPTSSAHPVYFLAGEPLSYVVPQLPPGAFAIGYVPWENIPNWGDTQFLRRIHALLASTRNDPVQTVSVGPLSDGFKQTLAQYGLTVDGSCTTTPGRPEALTWCKLARRPPAD